MRRKIANSSNRLKKFVRNLTDPDCNDYLASCCNCCAQECCGINCEYYPISITLTMTVISGNEFCDNLYETAELIFSTGGCESFGTLEWIGTIANGVAGILRCTAEGGFEFNSECDPLNWHPIDVITCCDPFEAEATVEFTNFFGTCCEGTVELHFLDDDFGCGCCDAETMVTPLILTMETNCEFGPCEITMIQVGYGMEDPEGNPATQHFDYQTIDCDGTDLGNGIAGIHIYCVSGAYHCWFVFCSGTNNPVEVHVPLSGTCNPLYLTGAVVDIPADFGEAGVCCGGLADFTITVTEGV